MTTRSHPCGVRCTQQAATDDTVGITTSQQAWRRTP